MRDAPPPCKLVMLTFLCRVLQVDYNLLGMGHLQLSHALFRDPVPANAASRIRPGWDAPPTVLLPAYGAATLGVAQGQSRAVCCDSEGCCSMAQQGFCYAHVVLAKLPRKWCVSGCQLQSHSNGRRGCVTPCSHRPYVVIVVPG
jgi:hypothetical protein